MRVEGRGSRFDGRQLRRTSEVYWKWLKYGLSSVALIVCIVVGFF